MLYSEYPDPLPNVDAILKKLGITQNVGCVIPVTSAQLDRIARWVQSARENDRDAERLDHHSL